MGFYLLISRIQVIPITGERYCKTLKKLRREIQAKHPGRLRNAVILLHDYARPQIANIVTLKLFSLKLKETLEHKPYSSKLSPSPFHAFRFL